MSGVSIRIASGALALVTVVALAACGSSSKEKNGGSPSTGNTLAISLAGSGKAAKVTAPKAAKGGLTTVKFTNNGKQPHTAQLLLLKGNHTAKDVAKAFSGADPTDKAEWLRARGGVGTVPPGQTQSGTVTLEPGHYLVGDFEQEDAPPIYAELNITPGKTGSLPSTDTTVTAAEAGKDKWRWDISGPLKTGGQDIRFKSEGKEALHFVIAVQIKGNVPEKKVIKEIGKPKPPSFIDEKTFTSTAILDGGKSQVTRFVLSKPGRWLLFCPLTDRGEKEEHDKQGLAKVVTVQ